MQLANIPNPLGTIVKETKIHPREIADAVIRELEAGFDSPIPDRPLPADERGRWPAITTRQELVDELVADAERAYLRNPVIQKRLRKKWGGAKYLAGLMRYSITAMLHMEVNGEIIPDFWFESGQTLPYGALSLERARRRDFEKRRATQNRTALPSKKEPARWVGILRRFFTGE